MLRGNPKALLNSSVLLDTSPSLNAIYGCIFLCRIVERTLYKGTIITNGRQWHPAMLFLGYCAPNLLI